jgi:hypothetical protein
LLDFLFCFCYGGVFGYCVCGDGRDGRGGGVLVCESEIVVVSTRIWVA